MNKISLGQLIDLVTEELRNSESRAKRRNDPIMQFTECEIEMGFEIEAGGTGSVGIWVLNLGGSINKTESNTIKVKFSSLKERQMAFPTTSPGDGPTLGYSEEQQP